MRSHGRHDGGHGRLDLGPVAHLHGHAHRASAHGLDLGHEVGPIGALAYAKGHVGTGIGQGQRDGATQSARRARDQRGPAIQAEVRVLSHGCSCVSLDRGRKARAAVISCGAEAAP